MKLKLHPLSPLNGLDALVSQSVGQRAEEEEAGGQQNENSDGGQMERLVLSLGVLQILLGSVGLLVESVELTKDEIEAGTGKQSSAQMSGKVMMQELLSTHEEEGEEMCAPGKEEEAHGVVEL